MAGFYEGLRDNTATPLIEQYGQDMTIVRNTSGGYDPVTGFDTGSSSQELPAKGVLTELSEGSSFSSNGQSVSSNVLVGDRMVLLAATQELQDGDQLKIGTEVWTVVDYNAIEPAGVTVVYEVHVRK